MGTAPETDLRQPATLACGMRGPMQKGGGVGKPWGSERSPASQNADQYEDDPGGWRARVAHSQYRAAVRNVTARIACAPAKLPLRLAIASKPQTAETETEHRHEMPRRPKDAPLPIGKHPPPVCAAPVPAHEPAQHHPLTEDGMGQRQEQRQAADDGEDVCMTDAMLAVRSIFVMHGRAKH